MPRTATALLLVVTWTQLASAQAIHYVDGDSATGGDGLSWATAYDALPPALTAAQPGDQIWVAGGTYVGNFTLALGAEMYGGFAGSETLLEQRDWTANETILDGNRSGSVVTGPVGATETTRIDGFTITGGSGTVSGSYALGGGIYLNASSPTVANNTITRNRVGGSGGGLYVRDSSPTVANNRITGNSASQGGGLRLYRASSTIANNTVSGNSADYGGGLSLYESPAIVVGNTVTGNTAPNGGGLSLTFSSPTIVNTIIAFNASGVYGIGSTPTLRHNCVYGNTAYDYYFIADPTGTEGNISVDPRFAGSQHGNLHIQPDSPCGNAGSNADAWGNTDMDAEPRIIPGGGTVDIGADESDGTVWAEGPYTIVRVSLKGDDANDGSAWGLAKHSIQAGINAAHKLGGEVWVRFGTYEERIVLHSYVYVYGGFAGTESVCGERDWVANVTILDGQQQGSVVTCWTGHMSNAIDGFTITNGSGTALGAHTYGGGLLVSLSDPAIVNNTITGNRAYRGGGVYLYASSSTILNNVITNNHRDSSGGGLYVYDSSPVIVDNMIADNIGSGVYVWDSSPMIKGNTITGNSDSNGGGILVVTSSATITNNTIAGNSASDSGGGLAVSQSVATITNNTLEGNTAGHHGGGLHIYSGSLTIANNKITANSAGSRGGGLSLNSTSPTVANNTISGNTATSGGGGISMLFSLPTIANNIIAFNSSGILSWDGQVPTLRFNCVYGNAAYDYLGLADPTGTDGNISADPLFVQAPNPGLDGTWGTDDDDLGDLHLSLDSPVIDAGDNAEVPADAADDDDDGDTNEPMPFDFDSFDRYVDDPRIVDTGAGTPPIVDIGAYERRPGDCTPSGEATHDGDVDLADYVGLEACLVGPDSDPPANCGCFDLDDNGHIDLADVAVFQMAFTGT